MRDSEFLKILREYTTYLREKVKKISKRIEKNSVEVPDGTLKYHRSKKGLYFYSLITGTGEQYLGKRKRHIASAIAQHDYDYRVLHETEKTIKRLESVEKRIESNGIEAIYEKTVDARKQLITPVVPDMEKYAAEWENLPYEKKPIGEGVPDFITEKDEHVRSKSELIIANALHRHNIPYKYECPLTVGRQIIHPDFTILDKRSGKLIYWEHLGMLDDTYYRQSAMKRIADYEAAGYFSGTEMIYTLEGQLNPLSTAAVENKIRKYLCN